MESLAEKEVAERIDSDLQRYRVDSGGNFVWNILEMVMMFKPVSEIYAKLREWQVAGRLPDVASRSGVDIGDINSILNDGGNQFVYQMSQETHMKLSHILDKGLPPL